MTPSVEEERAIYQRLKDLLSDAIEKNDADALLLSGGLDTSVLAALSYLKGRKKEAFTVVFEHTPASDLGYATLVAQKFRCGHHLIRMAEKEALEVLPAVINILKSFDPALPNDLVIYVALKEAKRLGIKSIMTGDGADELFAGYSYMQELPFEELKRYIRALAQTMQFSSNLLSSALGIAVKQPYCDPEIVNFAVELDPDLKIRERNGMKYGKWVLRKAFEAELDAVAWRTKEPIEFGSGATKLREIIGGKISDTEFEAKKRAYRMDFMNKEHLFFYEIYKEVVGRIPKPEEGRHTICPLCKAELPEQKFHCRICGFSYPLSTYLGEKQ